MVDCLFAIPGDITLPTGGYAYDRRVLALLPGCGVAARHVALPGAFPFPTDADLAETERLLATEPADARLLMRREEGWVPMGNPRDLTPLRAVLNDDALKRAAEARDVAPDKVLEIAEGVRRATG